MAAHDNIDLNSLECGVVEVVAHEGKGHEPGSAPVAGAMVCFPEVVVDRLGDMADPEFVIFSTCHLIDDIGGFGGVIAADIEKISDVVFLEDPDQFLAIILCSFFPY